ncbi:MULTISPECIES: hypothetical protein [unclassified Streptomyces]|uniref:hypothetical protein n=1 Tax=unclassified Streptomyces TaxID=2593676 RepID=UPI00136B268B|nr:MULTISPECIES: hypothetical protein [unclassified Streptomyces]NEA05139.1 hypothetical protein [Streptomyces sp. SID10116]MYY87058.1 hypothetical protein [Streptomyces sp. SID335]MYZ13198.1 hypothetical protein [Streptomyces sp. SID337]NDZ89521.1 hypothetical protein [Streptomyces sp. SID10115]NEB49674.1 hypothetical protein [Streptomyces sp. SID339]
MPDSFQAAKRRDGHAPPALETVVCAQLCQKYDGGYFPHDIPPPHVEFKNDGSVMRPRHGRALHP